MRRRHDQSISIPGWRRFGVAAAVGAAIAVALTVSLPASGAPPSVGAKQRQAASILAQINALDSDLNRAVESYNGARLHLAQTEKAIALNAYSLRVARHNLDRARRAISMRLVALYTGEGESTSQIEVILGARSLDDVLSRLDVVDRVTTQDARIAGGQPRLGDFEAPHSDRVDARSAPEASRIRERRDFADSGGRTSAAVADRGSGTCSSGRTGRGRRRCAEVAGGAPGSSQFGAVRWLADA